MPFRLDISRWSSLSGHSLQLRTSCRKDWLFVRKEALVSLAEGAPSAPDPIAPSALTDPGLVLVRGPGSSGLLDERKGWIMSVKLTDVQLVMMSAAGQRHDRCLAAPETMKGAALSKARENGRRMDKRSMAGFDPARSATWTGALRQ